MPKRLELDQCSGKDESDVCLKLEAALGGLQFVASAAKQVLSGLEPDCLASARLQHLGTRDILMTSKKSLHDFLAASGGTVDASQLGNLFVNMTPEDFEKFTASVNVWKASLKPSDLLYTPMGMVIAESVGEADSVSVRATLVPCADPTSASGKMLELLSGTPTTGSTKLWTFLQAALAKL